MEPTAWVLIVLLCGAFVAVVFTTLLSLTRREDRVNSAMDGVARPTPRAPHG